MRSRFNIRSIISIHSSIYEINIIHTPKDGKDKIYSMPLFPSESDKRVLYLCLREDRLDTGNPDRQNHKFIMGSFFLFTPFIILMFVALMNAKERKFLETGIDATGKILSATETGTYVNNLPKLAFRIQVFRSGFTPYEVEHEAVVSFLSIPRLQAGAIVNIKLNPQNSRKIIITDV